MWGEKKAHSGVDGENVLRKRESNFEHLCYRTKIILSYKCRKKKENEKRNREKKKSYSSINSSYIQYRFLSLHLLLAANVSPLPEEDWPTYPKCTIHLFF